MRHYGIEIIGYGKRRRYVPKQIFPGNGTTPIGKACKTEEEARAAAAAYGVEVEAVGDLWELLAAIKED